jgi:hypothetical protein
MGDDHEVIELVAVSGQHVIDPLDLGDERIAGFVGIPGPGRGSGPLRCTPRCCW